MEQTVLFENPTQRLDRWFVSYVLASLSQVRRGKYGIRSSTGKSIPAFVDLKRSPREMFENIRQLSLGRLLFRDKYCVTFIDHVASMYSREVTLLPLKSNDRFLPTHFGYVDGTHSFFWDVKDLLKECDRIEQFSGCRLCPHFTDPETFGSCIEANVQKWLKKRGFLDIEFPRKDDYVSDILEDHEELSGLLKKLYRKGSLRFVPPGTVGGPFQHKHVFIDEFALKSTAIEDSIEERRVRAIQGSNTKRALKICKKECYFYNYCSFCMKPYAGQPFRCQQGMCYYSHGVPGPFSESEIMEAALRNIAEKNPLPREKIALIAYHGGQATSVLGQELILRGMDAQLREVEFMHERSGKILKYAFRDAVEIMRARVYENGSFSRNIWHPEQVPPMPDRDFIVYAQLNEIRDVFVGMGYYQPVSFISWFPDSSSFRVSIRNNYSYDIGDLLSAANVKRYLPGGVSIAPARQIKAVREAKDPETS